jgi:DNA polymerase theta
MARWLDAHSFETRYRPIPIEEHLVCNGCVYGADDPNTLPENAGDINPATASATAAVPVRKIQPSVHKELSDPVLNCVVTLAHETASSGYGALVFAGSRSMCESVARCISRVMPQLLELSEAVMERRLELLDELRSLPTGLDHVLEETVLYGVAFHRKQ